MSAVTAAAAEAAATATAAAATSAAAAATTVTLYYCMHHLLQQDHYYGWNESLSKCSFNFFAWKTTRWDFTQVCNSSQRSTNAANI